MLLGSLAVNASQVPTAVDELLDGFHQAAAESNFDDYYSRSNEVINKTNTKNKTDDQ